MPGASGFPRWRITSSHGVTVIFDPTDDALLDEAVEIVHRMPKLKRNFPAKQLRSTLEQIVILALSKKPQGRGMIIARRVDNLVREMRKDLKLWDITIPVSNLDLATRRRLQVGHVIFRKMTKARMATERRKVRVLLAKNRKMRAATRPPR